MGLFDEFDDQGTKKAPGLFDEFPAPDSTEKTQPETPDYETQVMADTGIGLARGTISALTSIPRAGLLAADAVALAGQKASSTVTGVPVPADESYLPSKKLQAITDTLGKGADAVGLPTAARPTQWSRTLGNQYSDGTKQAQAQVGIDTAAAEAAAKAEGKGFVGTTLASAKQAFKSVAQNPAALTPLIAENVPQLLTTSALTRKAIKPVADDLAAQVAAGAITKKAADQALRRTATAVSAGTEGAMVTGQVEQQITEANPEAAVLQRLAAIPAGLASAAISQATGRIPGLGNVESNLVTRGLTEAATDSRWTSAVKGLITEGLLEEPLQEGQEQVWQNVALGNDLSKDVGASMAQGALAGGPMGMVGGAITGGRTAESDQEKLIKGTLDRIKSSNLSPQELVALRESPKALTRLGLDQSHIDELLQGHDQDAVEIATFKSLLDNAPSDAVRQGLLASTRGTAYQKLVSSTTPAAPAPKVMSLNDAVIQVANRRAELADRADLTPEEATELKSLNKLNMANPNAVEQALGVKLKLTKAQKKAAEALRTPAPAEAAPAEAAPAETAPAETAPAETAPAETTETAPTETAKAVPTDDYREDSEVDYDISEGLPDLEETAPAEPIKLYRGEAVINDGPTPSSTEGAFFYGEADKDKAKGYTKSIRNPEKVGAVRELEVPGDIAAKLADLNDEDVYNSLEEEDLRNGVWARGNNPTPEFNQALRDKGYTGFKVQRPGDDTAPGKIEYYLLPETYKDLKYKPIPTPASADVLEDDDYEEKDYEETGADLEAQAQAQEEPTEIPTVEEPQDAADIVQPTTDRTDSTEPDGAVQAPVTTSEAPQSTPTESAVEAAGNTEAKPTVKTRKSKKAEDQQKLKDQQLTLPNVNPDGTVEPLAKTAPKPKAKSKEAKPKEAKSYSTKSLLAKATKRIRELRTAILDGNSPASYGEELRILERAKERKDGKALSEHFGVQLTNISKQVAEEADTIKKLKEFNEKTATKKAETAEEAEQARLTRVEQAKKAEEAFIAALDESQRTDYTKLQQQVAEYRKKAIAATKAKDKVQASANNALAGQVQDQINKFRSVHASLYKLELEPSSVAQADSKSVQNSNVQLEKSVSPGDEATESVSQAADIQGKLSEATNGNFSTFEALGENRQAGGVVVRQTVLEAVEFLGIPVNDVEYYSLDGVTAQALRDPKSGLTVLIADNLTEDRAYSVLVHEVGVHGMPDITLDTRATGLIKEFYDTKFIQGVLGRLKDAGLLDDSGMPTNANEARAYLVEEALYSSGQKELDSKFWAKLRWAVPSRVVDYLQGLATKVKHAFVSLGALEPSVFTAQDLVNIARSAVERQSGKAKTIGKVEQSFIGPNANLTHIQRASYEYAEVLKQKGYNVSQVLDRTGWWEYIPGEWMHEITSTEEILTNDTEYITELQSLPLQDPEAQLAYVYALEELIYFPALSEAYPDILSYDVYLARTLDYIEGSIDHDERVIRVKYVDAFDDLVPTLIHEIQHAIQLKESWERGASPDGPVVKRMHRILTMNKENALFSLMRKTPLYNNKKKLAATNDYLAGYKYEALDAEIDKLYEGLKEHFVKGPAHDMDYKVLSTPVPSRLELYQRTAGETLARLASVRYEVATRTDEDITDTSLDDALVGMLYNEGLLDSKDTNPYDRLISLKAVKAAFGDNDASLDEALAMTAEGKSPSAVAEKTGWFENSDGILTQDGKSPEVEGAVQFSKVRKGRLSKADKDAVKVLEKIYGAKGKDLNQAIAEAAEDLKEAPSNPMSKKLYDLTKRTFGAYSRGENRQTSSWLERVFSSPEFYFQKTKATQEVLQAAIDDSDIRYRVLNQILGGFQETASTLARKYPKLYEAGKSYLVNTDQTGIGFKMRIDDGAWAVMDRKDDVIGSFADEVQARNAMLKAEQDFMTKKLYDPKVRQFVYEARQLTNRAFDIVVQDMRRQIIQNTDEGLPEPKSIFIDEDGKHKEVSLSELIAHMGDLRGTYFPRERVARSFHLVAEQDGKPSILETFDWHLVENELGNNTVEKFKRTFNNLAPAGRRVQELIKKGYKAENIFVKPVKTPSELLFDLPGTLSTLDAFLTEASDKLKEADMKEADLKLLAAADQALALRIADIYRSKGNLSSRIARADKLFLGYEEDPIRALTGYATRVATGVAKRTTAKRMLKAFTGRILNFKEFKDKFGQDKTYKQYLAHVRATKIHPSKQKNLYEDTRQYMRYFLAPASGAERAIGYLKAAAVFKYLGFRVMSAAINSTSLVISVPGTIAGHTGASLKQVGTSIARAIKVFTAYKHNQLVTKGYKFLGRPMSISQQDHDIMTQIYENGWAVAQFNNEAALAMTGALGRAGNNLMQASMYMFGKAEELNRAVTIFAAFDVLAKHGLVRNGVKYDKRVNTGTMLALAKHASDRAHGIYGKAAKPWLVQRYRYLDAPYTFQKYQHSFHLNMVELFGKYKSPRAAAFLALMPQLVAGTSTLSAIGYAVAQMLGSDDPQEDYETLMSKVVGDSDLAETIVSYGIFGALTGASLKGSLETRLPLPTDFTNLAGAPQSVIMDLYDAAKAIKAKEYMKGLESIMPAFMASPLKGYREKTEGLTKANYAPVFFEGQRVYGDTGDFLRRIVSASPIRIAEIRNSEWREDEARRVFQERRTKISSYYNHLLVKESTNAEDWADLWLKVDKYNTRAANMQPKYMIPQIDLEWLVQQQKRAFSPNKHTKYSNE